MEGTRSYLNFSILLFFNLFHGQDLSLVGLGHVVGQILRCQKEGRIINAAAATPGRDGLSLHIVGSKGKGYRNVCQTKEEGQGGARVFHCDCGCAWSEVEKEEDFVVPM